MGQLHRAAQSSCCNSGPIHSSLACAGFFSFPQRRRVGPAAASVLRNFCEVGIECEGRLPPPRSNSLDEECHGFQLVQSGLQPIERLCPIHLRGRRSWRAGRSNASGQHGTGRRGHHRVQQPQSAAVLEGQGKEQGQGCWNLQRYLISLSFSFPFLIVLQCTGELDLILQQGADLARQNQHWQVRSAGEYP